LCQPELDFQFSFLAAIIVLDPRCSLSEDSLIAASALLEFWRAEEEIPAKSGQIASVSGPQCTQRTWNKAIEGKHGQWSSLGIHDPFSKMFFKCRTVF